MGVSFHLGTTVQQVQRGDAHGFNVTRSHGDTFCADVALSAVGLWLSAALAQAAGIHTHRGIVISTSLQTSNRHVYALGDCAEVNGRVLPYVMPIMHAARALASTLAGVPTLVRYPAMPVAVKTPACPAVVPPPAVGAMGDWQVEASESGVKALFKNSADELMGFALLGTAIAEKSNLVLH